MRKLRKSIAVLIAAAVLLFARTGYLIVRPGTAEDLSQFVTVDEDTNKEQGTFYLVTVSQQRATPVYSVMRCCILMLICCPAVVSFRLR